MGNQAMSQLGRQSADLFRSTPDSKQGSEQHPHRELCTPLLISEKAINSPREKTHACVVTRRQGKSSTSLPARDRRDACKSKSNRRIRYFGDATTSRLVVLIGHHGWRGPGSASLKSPNALAEVRVPLGSR
jgi:hypothetical protein